jgi:hypothetical protein
MVSECPKLHAIVFGALCELLGREGAIGYHRVAMKVGVE